MRPLLQQSVLPLYGYAREHDNHRPLGTANLLEIAGRYFAVTASHVAEAIYEDGLQRDELSVPTLDGTLVPLHGTLNGDRSGEHDVALLEFEWSVAEKLAGYRFLTLANTDNSPAPPRRGWYCVHGYPVVGALFDEKAKFHGARPFTHITSLYEGPTSSLPIYDAARHVLVELDPEVAIDFQGGDALLPCDLRGISGSAVWRAFTYGGDDATWSPSDARVAAIETAVVRNERRTIIRGTRWFVVLSLLRRLYPDLASAIDLHQ